MKLNLREIISIQTGKLFTRNGMDDIYKIYNKLYDTSFMTHELPYICKQTQPLLNEKFPQFNLECKSNSTKNLKTSLCKLGKLLKVLYFNDSSECEIEAQMDSFFKSLISYYGNTFIFEIEEELKKLSTESSKSDAWNSIKDKAVIITTQ